MSARSLFGAMGAALALVSGTATAQDSYPARPIRLIVPQSAGSGGDVVARLLGEPIGKALGQSIVVENRPGANGIIAASFVAQSPPDGYTFMLAGVSQMSFNPRLYESLAYDADKDFTYVAPVVDTPFVLVASKSSGFTTMTALIEAARSKPGQITYGSAGAGNSTHLASEMIADQAGVKMMHVPFKGSGPALNAVIGGQVDLMTSVLGAALPQIQGGNVVPLAVLSGQRAADLPNVPTLEETGVKAPVMPGWFAVVGPAKLDPAIVTRVNDAVQSALADPQMQARLKALYLVPLTGTPQDMKQRAARDAETWGDFITRTGVRVQ